MRHNHAGVQHFVDTFTPFTQAQAVVAEMVETLPEFAHLRLARLPCILSQRALVERGHAMPGVVMEPQYGATSSARRHFVDWLVVEFVRAQCDGFEPDYLLLFDVGLWPDTDPHEAGHVVYHLLCHIAHRENEYGVPMWHDNGAAMLRLRNHDIERFTAEVERYGQTIQGIRDEHGVYAAARGRDLGVYALGRKPGHGRPAKRSA